jgi:uncharacterized protein YbbC (DUF1343 family)
MTAGELAMMACGEGWVRRPALHVVKMQGWGRNLVWQDLGLGWRRTSPNIPNSMSPFNYVATGILGSAAGVDVGIPWGEPFACAGGAGVNPQAMADACRRMGFSDVKFTPYSHGGSGGVKLSFSPRTSANLTALDVQMLAEINRQTHGATLSRMRGDQLSLFNKVYGSDSLYRDLRRGVPASRITASWAGYEHNFRVRRERYLLY